jgi:hypothetical protein
VRADLPAQQALELRFTGATNEAKDNVRYLGSLEPSFEVGRGRAAGMGSGAGGNLVAEPCRSAS